MNAETLKQTIRNSGVKQWQIADFIGISEYTLCKKLRKDVLPEFEKQVLIAVMHIKQERGL